MTTPLQPTSLPLAQRQDIDPRIKEAAQGMEAMFLDYMMKVMRSTVPKSEMSLENSATEIYRSMHDHEVAERISKAQGVGLAEQIVAYLEGQRYLNRVSPAGHVAHGALQSAVKQPDRTGGTHEGSVTQYPSNTE